MKNPEIKQWLENSRLFILNIMLKSPRIKKEFEEFLQLVEKFGDKPAIINAFIAIGKLFWKPGEP
jgi:hypothetical protein